MSTLTAPAPTLHPSPALAKLLLAADGQLPPVVELARQCCALVLRPCYDWQNAAVTPSEDLSHELGDETPDQYVTVLAPARLPGSSDFLFELVQEAGRGPWRMCYAYSKQLTELSPRQAEAASSLLLKHTGSGQLMPYWK